MITRKPLRFVLVCSWTSLLVLLCVHSHGQPALPWPQQLALLKEQRAKAEAAGTLQRKVMQEVNFADGWKARLWSSSFPAPDAVKTDYLNTYYREEITLLPPASSGHEPLVYAGDDELAPDFASKTDGFAGLRAAQFTPSGIELLVHAPTWRNIALIRLVLRDGVWRYDGDASIADTASSTYGVSNPKLTGPGKVEGTTDDKKVLFEVSADGVIRKNGALYRPQYASYDETYGLAEGYRASYRLRREVGLERQIRLGVMKVADPSDAIFTSAPVMKGPVHWRQGPVSPPHTLARGRSLLLSFYEAWNGTCTEVSVQMSLATATAPPRPFHHQALGITSSSVNGLVAPDAHPSIIAVREEAGHMAVLWKAMSMGTAENGYYVLLRERGDSYEPVNTLEMSALLPSTRAANPQEPKEIALNGLRQVHLTHHDGFAVDIMIAEDNSVTINGKPAAPANASISRLDYRLFLHALSPKTEQTYDVPLRDATPVPWWLNPALQPPFSHADYSAMCRFISWPTHPAINPATLPGEAIKSH